MSCYNTYFGDNYQSNICYWYRQKQTPDGRSRDHMHSSSLALGIHTQVLWLCGAIIKCGCHWRWIPDHSFLKNLKDSCDAMRDYSKASVIFSVSHPWTFYVVWNYPGSFSICITIQYIIFKWLNSDLPICQWKSETDMSFPLWWLFVIVLKGWALLGSSHFHSHGLLCSFHHYFGHLNPFLMGSKPKC